jgi:hypothetical protein
MAAWTWLIPVLSLVMLGGGLAAGVGPLLAAHCAIALAGAVIAAVHHADLAGGAGPAVLDGPRALRQRGGKLERIS